MINFLLFVMFLSETVTSEDTLPEFEFFKDRCDSGDSIEFLSNDDMTEIGMRKLESTSCGFFANNNMNLTRLNLPMLKNFYTSSPCQPSLKLLINGLTDKFCIRIEEATHFLASDFTRIESISSPFCNLSESDTSIFQDKICEIKNFSLSTSDTSCTRIFGNVVVKAGDEQFVEKLKSVTWIYGELLIEGTNLVKVDFFDSLQYVSSFNVSAQKHLILIMDNPNLISVHFPSLKKITAFGENYFVIQGNHPQLGKDYRNCMKIKNSLNSSVWDVPTIDGKSCKQILEVYGDNSVTNDKIGSVFIGIILWSFFF
ncbi:hypothetical protein CAEBREN_15990 [Caenorhabditis brenneri]|uniref:Receptor L-domain domain-containing protein n=1 Tax=Caenorhabditis brenneri TaxID=135651 RepID=G0P0H2_CAEBE|nr:hypothetical protein CAEBREN_15990 [Caenorhabditis brenneri]